MSQVNPNPSNHPWPTHLPPNGDKTLVDAASPNTIPLGARVALHVRFLYIHIQKDSLRDRDPHYLQGLRLGALC